MPYIEKITLEKARRINKDRRIYGTFAEIGAGQEAVNHFFKAGLASQTVAKSMSAYDMTFSDQIYGKAGRYVSENRLYKMLDHEYRLLEKRLKRQKGSDTRFFAFANTVATRSLGRSSVSYHHGWMGIRFQSEIQGPYSEIILHVNMLDKTRLQQHEALGILGVNLIYSAFYGKKDHKSIIKSLFDNFELNRVSIDVLRCCGPIFQKQDHSKLSLELIHQKSTQALMFQTEKNLLPSDALYEKPVVLCNSSLTHWLKKKGNIDAVLKYIKTSKPPVFIVNIDVGELKSKALSFYLKKYLKEDSLIKEKYILVSQFNQIYELKNFIRQATDQSLFILLDKASILQALETHSSYELLSFFSRLGDKKTTLLLLEPIKPSGSFADFYRYLIQTKHLVEFKSS